MGFAANDCFDSDGTRQEPRQEVVGMANHTLWMTENRRLCTLPSPALPQGNNGASALSKQRRMPT